MKAYVFPGQGSQKKGMGESLFDKYKDLIKKADEILGYSITKLCMEGPDEQLNNTKFTQPVLFIINALSYLDKIEEDKIKPDYLAGHSLGEYNALFAAGCIDLETGLRLVQKRGEIMSKVEGGGMAAVIGLGEDKIKAVIEKNNLKNIEIANYNSTFQIVITGLKDDVKKSEEFFMSAGARVFIPLKSSGAFHSSFMGPSKKEFEKYLKDFQFSSLKIPVISNVYARPYNDKDIKAILSDQITHSVKWTETIRYLMGKGVNAFEEIGPGKVLTGLIGKIQKEEKPLIIKDNPDEKIKEIKEEKNIKNNEDIKKQVTKKNEKIKEKTKKVETNLKKVKGLSSETLGSEEFKKAYNLKYSYITGGMYRGIASEEIIIKMAKAGMMGFFGTGGLSLEEIESAICNIQKNISNNEAYGMNLLYNPGDQNYEKSIIDLCLKYNVRNIEAAAFFNATLPLAKFRVKGLSRDKNGTIVEKNKIIGKVSRPEVAEALLSPAPEKIINKLLEQGEISNEEASLSKEIPIVSDICIEADSGGHTDQGVAYVLMPAIINLRDRMMEKYNYKTKVRVGAAGGIGTPAAAAAAFILGADFIVTGSINQCTIEAKTSNEVKDLLEAINVQDTEYAPAGDMFELGAKVQVLKKGVFFPARANKLYDFFKLYNSLDDINEQEKKRIQDKWFKRSFEEVYNDCKLFYPEEEIKRAESNPKHKMTLIFKWYFSYSTQLALNGDIENKVDFQIHCGPSLGAFNQWVKGTELESWKKRHVDEIAFKLLDETANLLNKRLIEINKSTD
jgi:trans-AT polyketide synthase/acyltransferase/oxidoreductase domain-containing protein